jgi:hypothetical protein
MKKYLLELLQKEDSNTTTNIEDIETWARSISDDIQIPSYLEKNSTQKIRQEIINVCFRENIIAEDILDKLSEYRYVDKICDLIRGKFIRWIRLSKNPAFPHNTLTKGGIVTDIKFLENGIHILVKNALHRFIQFKYDDCIVFQKLSLEELLYVRL